jgi:hypothetical protein
MWRETLEAMAQMNNHAKDRAFQSGLVMLATEGGPYSTQLEDGFGTIELEEVAKYQPYSETCAVTAYIRALSLVVLFTERFISNV